MGFVKYFKSRANEIEAQGFKVIPTSSDVLIKNHNGCCLSIYKPRGIAKEETFLYLDGPCGSGYGTESFIREWRDLDKLYSYIMKICLPKMKYFGGEAGMDAGELKKEIESILNERKIDFTFNEKLNMKDLDCHMYTDFEVREYPFTYPCFYFKSGKKLFGIYLQSIHIHLVEFDKDFLVVMDLPWYHFCPGYKNGREYVRTTVNNFLDFVENIDKYSFEKE